MGANPGTAIHFRTPHLGGSVYVLMWLTQSGYAWDATTFSRAAEGGHMEALKWLRENGCRWDASTCARAAGGGGIWTR
jgi:hypothetical protein